MHVVLAQNCARALLAWWMLGRATTVGWVRRSYSKVFCRGLAPFWVALCLRILNISLNTYMNNRARGIKKMADGSMNVCVSRKMSFGINGKLNGVEGKTPFLIGVSGGTASGKASLLLRRTLIPAFIPNQALAVHNSRNFNSKINNRYVFYTNVHLYPIFHRLLTPGWCSIVLSNSQIETAYS